MVSDPLVSPALKFFFWFGLFYFIVLTSCSTFTTASEYFSAQGFTKKTGKNNYCGFEYRKLEHQSATLVIRLAD
jgi:hypothetical protein